MVSNMVDDKVENVERFEAEEEFEAYFEVPRWAGFYITDEEYDKFTRINKLINEVLMAVQFAKKVGIEEFSIIRIKDNKGIPLYSALTKRILEDFGELLEAVEGLVDEGDLYKIELIDLNRYDCDTVMMMLDEIGEYDLDLMEAVALDCQPEEDEEEEEDWEDDDEDEELVECTSEEECDEE